MVFNSKSVFGWKEGAHIKADAQKAGELCAALRNSKQGLSPQTLLDASRAKDTVLHDEFEWDDGLAAEAYRKDQAAHILRCIVILQQEEEEETDAVPIRAFVPISETKGNYESIQVVVQNPDLRQRLIEDCLSDLRAFQRKYASLKDIVALMDEPIRRLQLKIENKTEQTGA